MGRSICCFLVGLAAGLLHTIPIATAFPEPVDFDGSLSRWHIDASAPQITYGIKTDSSVDAETFKGAVDEAAALWNQVLGSYFRYALVADGQSPQVTIELLGNLNGTRSTAGYTYFDEYDGTKPVHCSIVILVDDTLSYGSIAKTILHEMGHGLGLGHSLVPQSIMSYNLYENRFGLDVDDHAAAARLYPASGHPPKLPPGCAVGAEVIGTHGMARALPLILLLLSPMVFCCTPSWRRSNTRIRARQEISCTVGCQMMVGCGRFQSEKPEEYLGFFEDFSL